jgi:hypothetical protein
MLLPASPGGGGVSEDEVLEETRLRLQGSALPQRGDSAGLMHHHRSEEQLRKEAAYESLDYDIIESNLRKSPLS